jgi:hypothetical protein
MPLKRRRPDLGTASKDPERQANSLMACVQAHVGGHGVAVSERRTSGVSPLGNVAAPAPRPLRATPRSKCEEDVKCANLQMAMAMAIEGAGAVCLYMCVSVSA